MNNRRHMIKRLAAAATAAIVATSTPALANDLVTLVDSIELAPRDMILPGSVNGMVTFKACDGACDDEYRRARLTPDTRFVVRGDAVTFEDFRQGFAVIRTSKTGYALLSVDAKNNTIKSIEIQG